MDKSHNAALLGRARAEIADVRGALHALERYALGWDHDEDPLAAAAWAQATLAYGSFASCGAFALPELEAKLAKLGRKHVPGTSHRTGGGRPDRVLHVMTECYAVGGHTRMVQRWIERDTRRRSTVVLTAQRTAIPEWLPVALDRSGAGLAAVSGDLFARAKALRAVAAEHDLVVFHTHPYDVVPILAFADPRGRPPTIFLNHANLSLWAGASVSDVIACCRAQDAGVAERRRGIDAERIRMLPLILPPQELPDRSAARQELGLEPMRPVILTLTSAWKIADVFEPRFSDAVGAILEVSPDAIALVVGARPDDAWQALAYRTGGRVRALGPLPDVMPYLAAADVYVDSWPVSGGNTVLEAAAAGLPVVSLGCGEPDLDVVRPHLPALGAGLISAGSPELMAEEVARLLDNADLRRELRATLPRAVESDHGAGWVEYLELAVAAARERAGTAEIPESRAPETETWECFQQPLLKAEHRMTPYAAVAAHARELPEDRRPRGTDELVAMVDIALDLPAVRTSRRAVAILEGDDDAATRLVDRFRELRASGQVVDCVVAIPPARLDEGVALLEAALDTGDDVPIDVVPCDSVSEVAGPRDLLVEV